MKNTPLYLGHRSRIRKKFLTSQGAELQDYELLEILLFSANARQDTKQIAKNLIAKFGDISSVINADIEMLKSIEGIGESALVQIKIISQIIKRALKNAVHKKPVLNNWQAVLDYAFFTLKNLNHEVFCVLFLDKKHQLIAEELHGDGERDYVAVSARLIAKKALLLHASSVILMHNHPSGELRASNFDIKTTNEIAAVLKNLEIKIIDHLIISREGYFSFKEQGIL